MILDNILAVRSLYAVLGSRIFVISYKYTRSASINELIGPTRTRQRPRIYR